VQLVRKVHTRFDVAVGAVLWNWVAVQFVRKAQTRSDVVVGAVVWNWVAVQLVQAGNKEQPCISVRLRALDDHNKHKHKIKHFPPLSQREPQYPELHVHVYGALTQVPKRQPDVHTAIIKHK
jgi:hypothetical protein